MDARFLAITVAVVGAGLARGGLVVHEWGTFTSVAGDDGLALEWRPLRADDELPGFVHGLEEAGGGGAARPRKGELQGTVRMETPVLYFYASRETEVSVRVLFPGGTLTEWYPAARVAAGPLLDWGRVLIEPHGSHALPHEGRGNHYYAARDVDAAQIRTLGEHPEHERFLFYRGVGRVDVPLRVVLRGDIVHVDARGSDGIGEVLLFERRGQTMRVASRRELGDGAELRLESQAVTEDDVAGAIERMLLARGLYAKEARACVETWRTSWLEEGLRLFYVMPQTLTDGILPLSVEPKPAETVRVLVGRVEIVTPRMEAEARQALRQLADPRPAVRSRAEAALAGLGRFEDPVLRLVRASSPDLAPAIDERLARRP